MFWGSTLLRRFWERGNRGLIGIFRICSGGCALVQINAGLFLGSFCGHYAALLWPWMLHWLFSSSNNRNKEGSRIWVCEEHALGMDYLVHKTPEIYCLRIYTCYISAWCNPLAYFQATLVVVLSFTMLLKLCVRADPTWLSGKHLWPALANSPTPFLCEVGWTSIIYWAYILIRLLSFTREI